MRYMQTRSGELLRQLHSLVQAGNTVITVEHDMRMIAASDWVIDLGPGAGGAGGKIVAAGAPAEVARSKTSITARYLKRAVSEASKQ